MKVDIRWNMTIPLVDQDNIEHKRQKKLARTIADKDKALETFDLAKKYRALSGSRWATSRPGSKPNNKRKKKKLSPKSNRQRKIMKSLNPLL